MSPLDDGVLIAGGGPVGFTLAVILAQAGIPFTVLEASDHIADEPRAGTIHPPTLELYARIGATDEMLRRGFTVTNYQYRSRTEGVIAEFDLGVLAEDTAYPYRLMLEQHKVCYVLRDMLDSMGLGDRVLMEHRVESVTLDASNVVVSVQAPDGAREFRGPFLIGCDGGRSAVRKSMPVEFEGFTYDERFLVLSTPFDFGSVGYAGTNYIADPDEWRALFRVPGDDGEGLWRVVSPVDPRAAVDDLFDERAVQTRLQDFHPIEGDYLVTHRNIYNVHQRVASSFRSGRVFIAGDAAHVNNPLGGMGMNFGIHDSFNLAPRLVSVLNGADEETLDQYDRQRRTVAQEYLQRQTIENKNNISQQDSVAREAFYDSLRATVRDPDSLRTYLRRVAMIEGYERSLAIP